MNNGMMRYCCPSVLGCAYPGRRLYALIAEVPSLNTMPQLGTDFAYSAAQSLKRIPS